MNKEHKVVIAHGFTNEEIFALMRAVKQQFGKEVDIAFAMTTEHSLKMRLGEVVQDVGEEHEYLKNNPPGSEKK
ncbi:MAG: DUF3783 domain-containing protein [Sphaerochaetaceae bacterium]|nr:DUF3783 domain-containing protein [Sphaerochaetaceae bacterium]MDC7246806.1 DUF3783 domain-containing protein [Sphaerochaetaceae bacterium]